MEILLRLILLYLTIVSGSLFISEKFNKKIGKCIGLNLLLIVAFLYISGLVNLLLPAVWFTVILELTLGIIVTVKYIKNKEMDKLKEKLSSLGLLVFTISFFWIAIVSIDKQLTNWDQFSYWSYAARNMYISNQFIINPGIGMQYPPAPTIIQYFFMKVIGIYLQGFEAFSMQILAISLLLPWLENNKRKKWVKFAVIVLIFCLPTIFPDMIFYESSYPDVLLGLLVGYICIAFFKEEKDIFTILKILAGLSVLSLTKATGVYLSIIVVIIAAIYEILVTKKLNKNKKLIKGNKNTKIIFIALIVIILLFASWTIYKNLNQPSEGPTQTANAKENPINVIINSIVTTLFGVNDETFNEAVSNQTLVKRMYEVKAISSPITISIAGVIAILLIIVTYFIANKLENEKKKKAIIITICVFIGLVLYSGILQVAYITMFNKTEMLAHAGLERYLPTYLLGAIYIFLNYLLEYLDRKKAKTFVYILLTMVIVSMTPLHSIMNMTITSGIANMRENKTCNTGKFYSSQIEELAGEGAKTYVICQDDNKKIFQYMIRYYMFPTNIIGLNEFTENMDKINITLDEWTNTLKERKFEYVYVLDTDEEFYEYASSIFKDNKIENKTLYKIEPNDESIILVPVGGLIEK